VLGRVEYEPLAFEDIVATGERAIAAEIFRICQNEIVVFAHGSEIEGWIRGREGDMWRRAVGRNNLDVYRAYDTTTGPDQRIPACEYTIVYRVMNLADKRRHNRPRNEDALLVIAVLHDSVWQQYYLDRIDAP